MSVKHFHSFHRQSEIADSDVFQGNLSGAGEAMCLNMVCIKSTDLILMIFAQKEAITPQVYQITHCTPGSYNFFIATVNQNLKRNIM